VQESDVVWQGGQHTARKYDCICHDFVTIHFEHVCRETNVELSESAQLIVRRTKHSSKSIADKQLRQRLFYNGDPAT